MPFVLAAADKKAAGTVKSGAGHHVPKDTGAPVAIAMF